MYVRNQTQNETKHSQCVNFVTLHIRQRIRCHLSSDWEDWQIQIIITSLPAVNICSPGFTGFLPFGANRWNNDNTSVWSKHVRADTSRACLFSRADICYSVYLINKNQEYGFNTVHHLKKTYLYFLQIKHEWKINFALIIQMKDAA